MRSSHLKFFLITKLPVTHTSCFIGCLFLQLLPKHLACITSPLNAVFLSFFSVCTGFTHDELCFTSQSAFQTCLFSLQNRVQCILGKAVFSTFVFFFFFFKESSTDLQEGSGVWVLHNFPLPFSIERSLRKHNHCSVGIQLELKFKLDKVLSSKSHRNVLVFSSYQPKRVVKLPIPAP